jgi:hypothetical protein
MLPGAVEEKISDHLVGTKQRATNVVQGKPVDHFCIERIPQRGLRKKNQNIDDNEVLDYCWYQLKTTRAKFCHTLFLN